MMNYLLTATLVACGMQSSLAFADGQQIVPCEREAKLAAFREILNVYELSLFEMNGVRLQDAGVTLVSQKDSNVVVNAMVQATENGSAIKYQVRVEMLETYDNACVFTKAMIVPESN